MLTEPTIDYREERLTVGIRTTTPFNGMFAQVDLLLRELRRWVNAADKANFGPYFLRYHVIDMKGPMDIEVGFVVSSIETGDERVKPGVLPAGHYANLRYSRFAVKGNTELVEWAKKNGVEFDRWEDPAGDAFCCRYEAYLTNYRLEPHKKRWEVDLAIKLAD